MKKTLLLGLIATGLASSSYASVLGGWDFDPLAGGSNNFGASPYAATQTLAGVTVGGLTRGSGISTTGTGSANAWGGTGFIIATPTQANAIAAVEYATFSFASALGTLSFSSIDAFNVRRSGTGPSTGIFQYQIGAGSFVDISTAVTWGGTTSASGNAVAATSLSGISALQNVAANTTVTFRLVTWGATNAGGTWYLNDPSGTAGTDFSVSGTLTAVPEPHEYGVAIVGLLGVVILFRRRQKSQMI